VFRPLQRTKLLKDASILLRDVAADAATKVADTTRPTEQQLSDSDTQAPADTWVGPNGEARGPQDAVPSTGLSEKANIAVLPCDRL
jgi:Family of unknown function (DUF5923)